eukprot:6198074-Pleurochrysis_carterae.AAC.1
MPFGPYFPHLALLPRTHLVTLQYPRYIAIEAEHLTFCLGDPNITISTLARAQLLLTHSRRARLSFANRHSHAQFSKLGLHHTCTIGALRVPLPEFFHIAHDGCHCPLSAPCP